MIAALLSAAVLALAPASGLSPEARAAIAPVLDAIAAERAAQAELPPPSDDVEKLIRMGRLDQAGRRALGQVDFSKAPDTERAAARRAMGAAIAEVDQANLAELLKMVPSEGWFLRSQWGDAAARAAFHIVQHSGPEHWRRFLPVLETLAANGEVAPSEYALMFDRLAMVEGRPQRYGSQFTCQDGRYILHPLEDPTRIDELRASMGLGPHADYLAAFSRLNMPC